MTTYSLVRFYFNKPGYRRHLDHGLSLEEAQRHCNSPETSSRTATSPGAKTVTNRMGPWFDGYEKE